MAKPLSSKVILKQIEAIRVANTEAFKQNKFEQCERGRLKIIKLWIKYHAAIDRETKSN